MELIDLHMHSNSSDGFYSPNELIEQALKKGITTLSITDHDNIEGYKKIDYERFEGKVEIIKGIELSAKANKGRAHILGYGIDINNPELIKKMKELKTNSFYSMMSLLNQLRLDFGLKFDSDDIKEIFNSTHNIGRPDVALLMQKYGLASTSKEAFDLYLEKSYAKTRHTNSTKSKESCIDIIKNAGGLAVLAHPIQLKMDDQELFDYVKELKDYGLDGIEVYHSDHSKEDIEYYLKLADYFDLLISGGSDYHGGKSKPDIELGNTDIHTLSLVNHLRKRK